MADMDVASYLANRKAKKNAAKGGPKFKTFTATAAFMATEGGEDSEFESAGGVSTGGGAGGGHHHHHGASSSAASSSSTHHQISGPTASTLVAGEWVDDESQFSAQPRLVVGGGQVADLESLDLGKQQQQGAAAAAATGTRTVSAAMEGSGESIRPAPRRAQGDFPSLASSVGGSAPSAAPVASVWGRVDRAPAAPLKEELKAPAVEQQQQQVEKPVESEAKPNVWRPKSIPSSSTAGGPASRSTGPAAGGFSAAANRSAGPSPAARSTPPPSSSAPAASPSTSDTDGLKRAANPWKPRRPGNE